jgi:hypothetical protein
MSMGGKEWRIGRMDALEGALDDLKSLCFVSCLFSLRLQTNLDGICRSVARRSVKLYFTRGSVVQ